MRLARTYLLDLLILAAAGAAALEAGPDPWYGPPGTLIVVLPLLARRSFPFGAPAAVWLAGAAVSFAKAELVVSTFGVYVAGLAAALLLGHVRDGFHARVGLVVVVLGAAIVVSNDPSHAPADFFFTPALFALAWLAGFALRGRAAQAEAAEERASYAERERQAAARVAVAEERSRIARELHDVVAHAVSVMVLQVGAVRHGLPETLAEDREALGGVERAGRAALAEMRRLLGAMRREGDGLELAPQPGLDSLDSLLEQVGRAGLPVRLHVDGDRFALPRAIDLSAYRIVQEGLTNALRHAGAGSADVTLHYRPGELEVEIADDGVGAAAGGGLGLGLVGVRERVKIYGGEMVAGTAPEGGFVLSARLPLDQPAS